jgi:hypothetical protein
MGKGVTTGLFRKFSIQVGISAIDYDDHGCHSDKRRADYCAKCRDKVIAAFKQVEVKATKRASAPPAPDAAPKGDSDA